MEYPVAVAEFLEADELLLKRPTQVVLLAVPEQVSAVVDPPSLKVRWVVRLGQLGREGTRRRLVEGRRRLLTERLMRAKVVVILSPWVEALLLSCEIDLQRAYRLGFQRSVHPLVAAVLVGPPWGDALRSNPEPNPPDGQKRKYAEGGQRKT